MGCITLFSGSDNVIELNGLLNDITGSYMNAATVQVTVYEADGVTEVAGVSWPQTMTYVASSDGNYRATISDALAPVSVPSSGTAHIAAAEGSVNLTLDLEVEFLEQTGATVAWTSRSELEAMFGRANVIAWADLENEGVAADISSRIRWACDEASEDARSKIKGSPADGILCADRNLRRATTRLAGVLLYESRGIKDTAEDENGRHRLTRHEKLANQFFQRVKAGQIVLDSSTVMFPAFVNTERNLSTSQPFSSAEDECDDFFTV